MKYEYKEQLSAQRKAQLESFLHEHSLRPRSTHVKIYRGAFKFRHPKTGVLHEEFYVCIFMEGDTNHGICRVVVISDGKLEGFMKKQRENS